MLKAFLTPRWLGLHVLLVVSVGVLGWIGTWQWDKATAHGDWQNYGYALQWWLFAGFAVFLWIKMVLDELDPSRVTERAAQEPTLVQPDRRPAAPAPSEADEDDEDDELAAYNRHLRRLAENADS